MILPNLELKLANKYLDVDDMTFVACGPPEKNMVDNNQIL